MKCQAIDKFLQLPNMSNSAVFIGEPLNFKNKFKIYPPRVKEVVGNEHYG
jgi:hypothetical protein